MFRRAHSGQDVAADNLILVKLQDEMAAMQSRLGDMEVASKQAVERASLAEEQAAGLRAELDRINEEAQTTKQTQAAAAAAAAAAATAEVAGAPGRRGSGKDFDNPMQRSRDSIDGDVFSEEDLLKRKEEEMNFATRLNREEDRAKAAQAFKPRTSPANRGRGGRGRGRGRGR